MSFPVVLLVVFIAAALTSLVTAERLTHVDVRGRHPERSRHWSASGIPRIGGIAVFLSAPLAIVAAALIVRAMSGGVPRLPELAGSLTIGAAILFVIGLLDDLRGVRPFTKLIAQTAAALLVYRAGFSIEQISLFPGYVWHLGPLALPITLLWLVGVSNAFNLIDGLDGLAGGVAIIALGAIASSAVILGQPSVPIYTVALVGALLGFLKYNWPSARLFMGDSGSLVVGFFLAVLSVKGSTDSHNVTNGLIPIFALAYPLFDTGTAILRRWLRGAPISRADRRHIHHQLDALGLGPRKALAVIYLGTGFVALIGLLVAFAPANIVALATAVGVGVVALMMMAGIYWLQYHEFLEAGASFAHAIKKSRVVIQDKINARDLAVILRSATSIEEIQALLADSAETFRFAHMKLSDPFSRRQAAGRLTQELQALKLWKLEYPILQRASDEYDGLCLTIWSAVVNGQRPAGAERVARILAPAIAEWIGGRKRTTEEVLNAEQAKASAIAHAGANADRPRPIFIGDLRLYELERPATENTLEA
jgi:UDP-GlcNAc:undecaprenyl-phosphate/decaprenyl-phosphate GlcNAc-1-phosphate transferase